MSERRLIPVAEVRHVASQYSEFTDPSNRERLVLDLAHTAEVKYAQLEMVNGLKTTLGQLTEHPVGGIAMDAGEFVRLVIDHLENILGNTDE